MHVYNKTQYGIVLISFMSIFILLIVLGYKFEIGNNLRPLAPTSIVIAILIIAIALFYKLTITIDNEKIVAVFGIGLIKRTMQFKDINFDSIESVKFPWYYGIGIRLTPKGWLYNVKIGKAIFIQNKKKTKTFLVGTDEFDTIKSILNTKR